MIKKTWHLHVLSFTNLASILITLWMMSTPRDPAWPNAKRQSLCAWLRNPADWFMDVISGKMDGDGAPKSHHLAQKWCPGSYGSMAVGYGVTSASCNNQMWHVGYCNPAFGDCWGCWLLIQQVGDGWECVYASWLNVEMLERCVP